MVGLEFVREIVQKFVCKPCISCKRNHL